jgi:arylsulfatase A-like enzyme|tara:strand:+ start:2941 stop:4419 length:1479 start_codon:yes stop_codon:yes gene_type:complete
MNNPSLKKISFLLSIFLILSCNNDSLKKPNIILIVADDLGWSDLSYMGSSYYETPNIDKLSKSGITFMNGYASSANCAPSRATMLSGKYHTHHGIYTVGNSDRGNKKTRKLIPVKTETILDLDFFVIPEMLKKSNYKTGHFGKWHMGPKGFFPEQSGFDVNIGGNEHGGPGGYFSPYVRPNITDGPKGEYLTDRIGNEVVNFINENQKDNFFAYVPFFSVHTPIVSKPEFEKDFQNKESNEFHNRADYAGMIKSLDENIGKILEKIEELNLSKNTLIIFTSDNGGIRAVSNQYPLRAGKGSYYEGGIKVPIIFSWQGKIKAKTKSYERVSNIDFFPTIKKIINYEDSLDLDGEDLTPIFNGKNLKERELYFHFPIYLEPYDVHADDGTDPLFRTRPGSVIIKNDWKLHHYFEDNKYELYNLKNDNSELINLVDIHKEKTKELLNDLNNWRINKNAPIPEKLNPFYDQKYVDSLILLIDNNKISGKVNKNEKN